MEIKLSAALIADLRSRIRLADCQISNSKEEIDNSNKYFAYNIFDEENNMFFTAKIYFLSDGNVFVDCCDTPLNKMCNHIEQTLLYHHVRSYELLEKEFGKEFLEAYCPSIF